MTENSSRYMLIVSHTAREEALQATEHTIRFLLDHNINPVMSKKDLRSFRQHSLTENILQLKRDVDLQEIELAIALGGDGTILRAAETVRPVSCPIVTVNLGHVGFLAEMESQALSCTLEHILRGEYEVEERFTLEVSLFQDKKLIASNWAVNEVTVERRVQMVELSIGVDGHPLSTFGCDGVAIATPTGSTAYAFSAGGPVVWPNVEAILVVPIAAHALFSRPLVVNPDSTVEIQLSDRSQKAVLWCDGRRKTLLQENARVRIQASKTPLRLARMYSGVFTERLVRKFQLPVTGWREQTSGDR